LPRLWFTHARSSNMQESKSRSNHFFFFFFALHIRSVVLRPLNLCGKGQRIAFFVPVSQFLWIEARGNYSCIQPPSTVHLFAGNPGTHEAEAGATPLHPSAEIGHREHGRISEIPSDVSRGIRHHTGRLNGWSRPKSQMLPKLRACWNPSLAVVANSLCPKMKGFLVLLSQLFVLGCRLALQTGEDVA